MFRDRSLPVISQHTTTEGIIRYVRRPDGGLEVWLTPPRSDETLLSRSASRNAPAASKELQPTAVPA